MLSTKSGVAGKSLAKWVAVFALACAGYLVFTGGVAQESSLLVTSTRAKWEVRSKAEPSLVLGIERKSVSEGAGVALVEESSDIGRSELFRIIEHPIYDGMVAVKNVRSKLCLDRTSTNEMTQESCEKRGTEWKMVATKYSDCYTIETSAAAGLCVQSCNKQTATKAETCDDGVDQIWCLTHVNPKWEVRPKVDPSLALAIKKKSVEEGADVVLRVLKSSDTSRSEHFRIIEHPSDDGMVALENVKSNLCLDQGMTQESCKKLGTQWKMSATKYGCYTLETRMRSTIRAQARLCLQSAYLQFTATKPETCDGGVDQMWCLAPVM